jgi:aryl-alcohol dehydrogenase-like predicted oxidoreductase
MTEQTVERVKLGNTDIDISPMGTGTWAWGDSVMWGYGRSYSDADVHAAFDATLAAGINFFDTAEVYGLGRSERLLGGFIRSARHPVVVATKFMPFPFWLTKNALRRELRNSLKRLGMARTDLYQMHFPLLPVPIEMWMDAMADAVEAGLVRAVGVSNYDMKQMGRAHTALAKRGIPLASNQVFYSLLHRDPEFNGVAQLCKDLNVTLIAYSPLEKGILTGKYTPDNPPPGPRRGTYNREYLQKVQPLIAMLRDFGEAHGGKSPAQVALNWTICKGAVPIPGAKNTNQVLSNAGALGWRLTDDEVVALDELSLAVKAQ